jgi:hypothetical protein
VCQFSDLNSSYDNPIKYHRTNASFYIQEPASIFDVQEILLFRYAIFMHSGLSLRSNKFTCVAKSAHDWLVHLKKIDVQHVNSRVKMFNNGDIYSTDNIYQHQRIRQVSILSEGNDKLSIASDAEQAQCEQKNLRSPYIKYYKHHRLRISFHHKSAQQAAQPNVPDGSRHHS